MENSLDPQKIQQIVSYLQAMEEYRETRKRILLENELAITPIAAEFYGEYTVYKIHYAVLAIEESEDGDEEEDDLDFGMSGKKAKVETYEAYALSDQPDEDGYYSCFDAHSRMGSHLHQVKFIRVASIERHKVILDDSSARNTGAWVFPSVSIDNASATGKFGGGTSATLHFPPTADFRELRQRIKAVVQPLPAEPRYSDYSLTNNEFRALCALRND